VTIAAALLVCVGALLPIISKAKILKQTVRS
jgi:hypothetical protein